MIQDVIVDIADIGRFKDAQRVISDWLHSQDIELYGSGNWSIMRFDVSSGIVIWQKEVPTYTQALQQALEWVDEMKVKPAIVDERDRDLSAIMWLRSRGYKVFDPSDVIADSN